MVLKSSVTKGELANSTPLSQGKSSDELLQELINLNQAESAKPEDYVPPENKNLTEEFSKIITGEAIKSGSAATEKITSSDFMTSSVLPYLKSNEIDLFPDIPDSVLKIIPDSTANSQKYYKDTDKDVTVFFNAVKKVMSLDPEKLDSDDTQDDIRILALDVQASFENLSKIAVPKKLAAVHKGILVSTLSLHKVLESIINSNADPLKSMVIINRAEKLGQFWQTALYDYVGYPENKRSR